MQSLVCLYVHAHVHMFVHVWKGCLESVSQKGIPLTLSFLLESQFDIV